MCEMWPQKQKVVVSKQTADVADMSTPLNVQPPNDYRLSHLSAREMQLNFEFRELAVKYDALYKENMRLKIENQRFRQLFETAVPANVDPAAITISWRFREPQLPVPSRPQYYQNVTEQRTNTAADVPSSRSVAPSRNLTELEVIPRLNPAPRVQQPRAVPLPQLRQPLEPWLGAVPLPRARDSQNGRPPQWSDVPNSPRARVPSAQIRCLDPQCQAPQCQNALMFERQREMSIRQAYIQRAAAANSYLSHPPTAPDGEKRDLRGLLQRPSAIPPMPRMPAELVEQAPTKSQPYQLPPAEWENRGDVFSHRLPLPKPLPVEGLPPYPPMDLESQQTLKGGRTFLYRPLRGENYIPPPEMVSSPVYLSYPSVPIPARVVPIDSVSRVGGQLLRENPPVLQSLETCRPYPPQGLLLPESFPIGRSATDNINPQLPLWTEKTPVQPVGQYYSPKLVENIPQSSVDDRQEVIEIDVDERESSVPKANEGAEIDILAKATEGLFDEQQLMAEDDDDAGDQLFSSDQSDQADEAGNEYRLTWPIGATTANTSELPVSASELLQSGDGQTVIYCPSTSDSVGMYVKPTDLAAGNFRAVISREQITDYGQYVSAERIQSSGDDSSNNSSALLSTAGQDSKDVNVNAEQQVGNSAEMMELGTTPPTVYPRNVNGEMENSGGVQMQSGASVVTEVVTCSADQFTSGDQQTQVEDSVQEVTTDRVIFTESELYDMVDKVEKMERTPSVVLGKRHSSSTDELEVASKSRKLSSLEEDTSTDSGVVYHVPENNSDVSDELFSADAEVTEQEPPVLTALAAQHLDVNNSCGASHSSPAGSSVSSDGTSLTEAGADAIEISQKSSTERNPDTADATEVIGSLERQEECEKASAGDAFTEDCSNKNISADTVNDNPLPMGDEQPKTNNSVIDATISTTVQCNDADNNETETSNETQQAGHETTAASGDEFPVSDDRETLYDMTSESNVAAACISAQLEAETQFESCVEIVDNSAIDIKDAIAANMLNNQLMSTAAAAEGEYITDLPITNMTSTQPLEDMVIRDHTDSSNSGIQKSSALEELLFGSESYAEAQQESDEISAGSMSAAGDGLYHDDNVKASVTGSQTKDGEISKGLLDEDAEGCLKVGVDNGGIVSELKFSDDIVDSQTTEEVSKDMPMGNTEHHGAVEIDKIVDEAQAANDDNGKGRDYIPNSDNTSLEQQEEESSKDMLMGNIESHRQAELESEELQPAHEKNEQYQCHADYSESGIMSSEANMVEIPQDLFVGNFETSQDEVECHEIIAEPQSDDDDKMKHSSIFVSDATGSQPEDNDTSEDVFMGNTESHALDELENTEITDDIAHSDDATEHFPAIYEESVLSLQPQEAEDIFAGKPKSNAEDRLESNELMDELKPLNDYEQSHTVISDRCDAVSLPQKEVTTTKDLVDYPDSCEERNLEDGQPTDEPKSQDIKQAEVDSSCSWSSVTAASPSPEANCLRDLLLGNTGHYKEATWDTGITAKEPKTPDDAQYSEDFSIDADSSPLRRGGKILRVKILFGGKTESCRQVILEPDRFTDEQSSAKNVHKAANVHSSRVGTGSQAEESSTLKNLLLGNSQSYCREQMESDQIPEQKVDVASGNESAESSINKCGSNIITSASTVESSSVKELLVADSQTLAEQKPAENTVHEPKFGEDKQVCAGVSTMEILASPPGDEAMGRKEPMMIGSDSTYVQTTEYANRHTEEIIPADSNAPVDANMPIYDANISTSLPQSEIHSQNDNGRQDSMRENTLESKENWKQSTDISTDNFASASLQSEAITEDISAVEKLNSCLSSEADSDKITDAVTAVDGGRKTDDGISVFTVTESSPVQEGVICLPALDENASIRTQNIDNTCSSGCDSVCLIAVSQAAVSVSSTVSPLQQEVPAQKTHSVGNSDNAKQDRLEASGSRNCFDFLLGLTSQPKPRAPPTVGRPSSNVNQSSVQRSGRRVSDYDSNSANKNTSAPLLSRNGQSTNYRQTSPATKGRMRQSDSSDTVSRAAPYTNRQTEKCRSSSHSVPVSSAVVVSYTESVSQSKQSSIVHPSHTSTGGHSVKLPAGNSESDNNFQHRRAQNCDLLRSRPSPSRQPPCRDIAKLSRTNLSSSKRPHSELVTKPYQSRPDDSKHRGGSLRVPIERPRSDLPVYTSVSPARPTESIPSRQQCSQPNSSAHSKLASKDRPSAPSQFIPMDNCRVNLGRRAVCHAVYNSRSGSTGTSAPVGSVLGRIRLPVPSLYSTDTQKQMSATERSRKSVKHRPCN